MLKTRVIVGLSLLAVVVVFVQLGEWVFFGGVTLVTLLALWEFNQMMQVKGHSPSLFFAFAFALAALLNMQFPAQGILTPAFSLLFVLSLVWQLFQAKSNAPVVDWALPIAGGAYIGLAMSHLIGIRNLPNGAAWVWVTLFGVWGADTFAYFSGRAFGRHKFWPRHSPKKTWEGIFGGVAGGMVGAGLMALLFSLPLMHALAIGALASIVGPLGDLSISMMKRYAGVKDSSHLIPGHGGMLDRIDSVLFVAIVSFYYLVWVVI